MVPYLHDQAPYFVATEYKASRITMENFPWEVLTKLAADIGLRS